MIRNIVSRRLKDFGKKIFNLRMSLMPNQSRGFRAVVEAALSQRARVLALMFSVRKKKTQKY